MLGLTCCDDGVDDLQNSAHKVSINSVLSSKLAWGCQGGGAQLRGPQRSVQTAAHASFAYPLVPAT